MGKTILTSKQLNFLQLAQAQAHIAKNLYLTGGTALSEFYFKHRLSEDIDLFSEVDFNYYPFPRIEKGPYFGELEISSIYDIAVNKVHTISMKTRTRDYIDLYFILTKTEYKPEQYLHRLRIDSQVKFDWPLEAKNLAAAFLKVKDLKSQDFPKMLVAFDKGKMEKFFLSLAKSLEADIFKD